MYPITMTSDNATQIFDALCLGLNSITHDETARELGWLTDVRRAIDLLRPIRSAPPVKSDEATPLDVLAINLPLIAGGAPFEPSEEDWREHGRWSEGLGQPGRFAPSKKNWAAHANAGEPASDRGRISQGCD